MFNVLRAKPKHLKVIISQGSDLISFRQPLSDHLCAKYLLGSLLTMLVSWSLLKYSDDSMLTPFQPLKHQNWKVWVISDHWSWPFLFLQWTWSHLLEHHLNIPLTNAWVNPLSLKLLPGRGLYLLWRSCWQGKTFGAKHLQQALLFSHSLRWFWTDAWHKFGRNSLNLG